MEERQKHITYGQAMNLAADTYDIANFEKDSEFIDTVLLRADVFYAAMVKRQAALVTTSPAVQTAQRAIHAAQASTVIPPDEVPFGQSPADPPMAPMPPQVDSASLPELQGTGLGMHDASRWGPTDRRCPGCGMFTLVANLMDKGPKFECASRARTKNPNTDEWQTVSACNYTAWG